MLPSRFEPARMEVDIDLLSPNEQQPRLTMDEAKLEELAQSIKSKGIIQPILVRRDGAAYRIIAGERRWRAAQRAGLQRVPVVVRDVAHDDKQLLELALIENLQRENLNPVDEALAYQRLAEDFSLTQDQIAAAVGKDRSSVANFMRLLRLPEESSRRSGDRRALDWPRTRPAAAPRRDGAAAGGPRGHLPRACQCVKPKRSSSGFSAQGAAATAPTPVERNRKGRPHARGRGQTSLRPGIESPHYPARTGWSNRGGFRLRSRIEPDLRIHDLSALSLARVRSWLQTAARPWYK